MLRLLHLLKSVSGYRSRRHVIHCTLSVFPFPTKNSLHLQVMKGEHG